MLSSNTFHEFSKEKFNSIIEKEIIELCGKSPITPVRTNKIVDYLYGYLDDLNTKTIVIERKYIEKDFLIDFSLFYARSFPPYNRECTRLHFFSEENIEKKINSLILKYDEETHMLISNAYKGCFSVKPLLKRYIGKTLLETYPLFDEIKHKHRYYEALETYNVSMFGIPLKVNSVAFQEQDKIVSACATVSIWVALHKLKKLFNGHLFSPSEITLDCETHSPISVGRIFPSEGLSLYQISSIFRRSGFETQYYELSLFENNEELKNALFAYLEYGLPVILALNLKSKNKKSSAGFHAATVLGYSLLSEEMKKKHMLPAWRHRYCEAGHLVDTLYIHDDQIGPFSRGYLDNNAKLGSLRCNWLNYDYEEVVIDSLIIPMYPKIRLPYHEVYNFVKKLSKKLAVLAKSRASQIKSNLFLTDVKKYKEFLLLEVSDNSVKEKYLDKPMPRFFWVLRLFEDGMLRQDYLFDATDTLIEPFSYIEFSD